MNELIFTVSDFVAVFNQTLENAYPSVVIEGELSNFKISKNKWIYFDLKDDIASVRFFGTVFTLPGPLEEGMMLRVHGVPRLHPSFGFSIGVTSIVPVGEGAIHQAAKLLEAKLRSEGLFDPARKRPLPYPPEKIGLVTSGESAAYADFVKVLTKRWTGIQIVHTDVQVQGEQAVSQIVAALERLNSMRLDVIVMTRGGGSADDLVAFSSEQVTRAVAQSRIPTIVAIGHEVDISLAELAADRRASTPSNAAELLVPDKKTVIEQVNRSLVHCKESVVTRLTHEQQLSELWLQDIRRGMTARIDRASVELASIKDLVHAYDPAAVLQRGYSLITKQDRVIKSVHVLHTGDEVVLQLHDGTVSAQIK